MLHRTLQRLRRAFTSSPRSDPLALVDVAEARAAGLIVPTHRHGAGPIEATRDHEFVAALELTTAIEADRGLPERLRLSGWVASQRDRRPQVRVYVGDRVVAEQPAEGPRPDVVKALALGPFACSDPRMGFDLTITRPVPPTDPAELVLEIDDGVVYTRRLVGALPRYNAQPFVGFVEIPREPMVLGHTLQIACFRGWIATRGDGVCRVRIVPATGPSVEVEAVHPRPDVLALVGEVLGVDQAFGFDAYLELPSPLKEPLPVVLEFSDGEHTQRSGRYLITRKPDLGLLDTFLPDPPVFRELAYRHLRGQGLEFGGLHSPLPFDPAVASVRYADQHDESHARELYDQRFVDHYSDHFVHVDFIIDLDRDDLEPLRAEAFDFFVASGVFEHLANPLGFLAKLDAVMKPGSLFFLAVPDRDYSFDSRRACTPNEHLWGEYQGGVDEIDDDHVLEFMHLAGEEPIPDDPDELAVMIERFRASGPHAHVWTQASFDDFFAWAIEKVPLHLEVVDRATSRQAHGNIVYVLRRLST